MASQGNLGAGPSTTSQQSLADRLQQKKQTTIRYNNNTYMREYVNVQMEITDDLIDRTIGLDTRITNLSCSVDLLVECINRQATTINEMSQYLSTIMDHQIAAQSRALNSQWSIWSNKYHRQQSSRQVKTAQAAILTAISTLLVGSIHTLSIYMISVNYNFAFYLNYIIA